jgi:hypothetical protein
MTTSVGVFPSAQNYSVKNNGYPSVPLKVLPQLAYFTDKKQFTPKKTFGDQLAIVSTVVSILANLLLFASPRMAKVIRSSPKIFKSKSLEKIISPSRLEKIRNFLGDEQSLAQFLQSKGVNFAHLFQTNCAMQLGFHTHQPAKILAASLTASYLSLSLFKYKPILDCAGFLSTFFLLAGESNDIHNNADPAHRKEWDPARLKHPFSPAPDGSKTVIASFFKTIGKDCSYPLSLKPWGEMREYLKHFKQNDWSIPQSFETAIGSQLQFLTFCSLMSAYILKQHGTRFFSEKIIRSVPPVLTRVGKYTALISAISFIPIFTRAWQNRQDKASLLTLFGVPLAVAYQVLNASPFKLDSRKGLFVNGFPMMGEGNLCNAKHYRSQINYLNFIYKQASRNPQLTADDFINYLKSNKSETDLMAKAMGSHRVKFIQQTLERAQQENTQNNVSLASFLFPMVEGDTEQI